MQGRGRQAEEKLFVASLLVLAYSRTSIVHTSNRNTIVFITLLNI